MLWRHSACISLAYLPRALFLTLMSLVNWALGALEDRRFKERVAAQRLHPEPVFILGHPRTGTTHMHNLLARDGRFAYATTYQVGLPAHFLLTERYAWLLSWALASTRPMDNMALSFATPGEDELAVNVMSGGASPYMALAFMPRFRSLLRLCSFDARGGDAEVADAAERWMASFLWFMKKVTLADSLKRGGDGSAPRPLLIKSPVHTARLELLLRLFPKARFIFLHREPLEVFASAAHMAASYFPYVYLTWPSDADITDYTLLQHQILYAAYLRDRGTVPRGQLVEVAFAELDADPVAAMRRVYRALRWEESWAAAEPAVRAYTGELAAFKKNDLRPLPPRLRARVERECREAAEAFGYRG